MCDSRIGAYVHVDNIHAVYYFGTLLHLPREQGCYEVPARDSIYTASLRQMKDNWYDSSHPFIGVTASPVLRHTYIYIYPPSTSTAWQVDALYDLVVQLLSAGMDHIHDAVDKVQKPFVLHSLGRRMLD